MSDSALREAYAAMQGGDLERARLRLRGLDSPMALHLSALVEKRSGRHQRAAELFERAGAGDPHNPEIANNQGLNARAMGDHAAAVEAFSRALAIKPDFASARQSLSRSLVALERWQEAEEQAHALLAAAPGERKALYTLASVRLEQGDAEAADQILSRLIARGDSAPAIHFVRGRAKLELDRLEDGISDLQKAYEQAPDELALRTLAGVYWMSRQRQAFDTLLARAPAPLGAAVADMLRQSGEPDAAEERWRQIPDTHRDTAQAWRVKSNIHQDQGQAGAALEAAERAVARDPADPVGVDLLATAQLMCARSHEALETARTMRARQPLAQNWIALEATALRQLGAPEYEHLVRVEEHVRAYELPVPEGYDSLEQFNAEFAAALDRHRRFSFHPLNQSLRSGAQTARSLTSMQDPVVRAYLAALDGPIRAYMSQIGRDRDHPLSARNTGEYTMAGCWSVRLQGGGRHVDHIHPQGWISSAYYAELPEETLSGDKKAGWIRFGQPPFPCDPPLPAERWIRPKAGTLVLFPSFLWHGTEPISDGSSRVTAPFDLVPA